jgi:hypothetical protein
MRRLAKQQHGLQHESDVCQTRRLCHKRGVAGTQTTWSRSAWGISHHVPWGCGGTESLAWQCANGARKYSAATSAWGFKRLVYAASSY